MNASTDPGVKTGPAEDIDPAKLWKRSYLSAAQDRRVTVLELSAPARLVVWKGERPDAPDVPTLRRRGASQRNLSSGVTEPDLTQPTNQID